jgi:hypothetical protein
MADTKITALAAITTVDPAADVFPIVDISDTSMAASGTTKKITSNQLLGAGGTATLASATITGAATVGTTLGVTNSFTVGTGANSAVQKAAILGGYTVFENSAGTGNPSITFNNDTDTGILNNGANVLQFNTAGVERARFNTTGAFVLYGGTGAANGIGVAFPTTQSASSDANCLDDYEEGTFLPVVQGSTTAGSGAYTQQVGRYTKIGRLVTVEIYLIWTTHTGTGNLRIGGLPFNVADAPYSAVTIGLISDVSLSASNMAVAFNEINQNFINIYQIPVGGGAYSIVPMDASGTMILSSTYTV